MHPLQISLSPFLITLLNIALFYQFKTKHTTAILDSYSPLHCISNPSTNPRMGSSKYNLNWPLSPHKYPHPSSSSSESHLDYFNPTSTPKVSSPASQGSNQQDTSNTRVPQVSPLWRILHSPSPLAQMESSHPSHHANKGQVAWFFTPSPSPPHLGELTSCHAPLAYSTGHSSLFVFLQLHSSTPPLLVFIPASVELFPQTAVWFVFLLL